ncbi:MAG: TonB-dependent receptor [Pseudomonadota bacterium]
MQKLISLTCAVLLGAATQPACAQEEAAASEHESHSRATPQSDPSLPAVVIPGSRANDTELRRLSTASKLIYGREELDRNGDSTVGEILKRLPGVTIGGRPGRGGEVRMRGMAGGYTQMLVNGERPPGGFSLDSLSPDQVERIEIIRGTIAENSTRAIAGTINIILREGYLQKDTTLKLTDQIEQGRNRPNLSITHPGRSGALTWLLSGTVSSTDQADASATHNEDVTAAGVVQKDQQLHDSSARKAQNLHLTPRLSYKFENGDTLNFQPFLMSSRSDASNTSLLDQRIGAIAPEYALSQGRSNSSSTFLRGFGNFVHRMAMGSKLDVKFGAGTGHSSSESQRQQYNAAGAPSNQFVDTDATHDRNATLGVKYNTPLGAGHQAATGADAEFGKRDQTRVSLDNGDPQFDESGANLSASTRRFAAYAQDEWDLTPQWAMYLGLRWEGIKTRSATLGKDIANDSSVWSPMMHAVYRIPGKPKDQVRIALTHAYKAPALNDLIAAPTLSRLNSATRPDRNGNPELRPELSHGIDLAYEHYLGRSGILSASGFLRDIKDLIRRETVFKGTRWVSAPANIGHAQTTGIELEAKFQLTELMPDGPNIDFRSNYSHFWSHVDGIPGPNNRLAQQPSQTANVGMDYRFKPLPLTLGASFNWTPAIEIQNSLTEVLGTGIKRQLDVYGLWKFGGRTQLRVAANNLLSGPYFNDRVVTTNGLAQMAETTSRTYTSVSVKLEFKI